MNSNSSVYNKIVRRIAEAAKAFVKLHHRFWLKTYFMEQNPVDEIFINLICFATTSHRQSGDPHLKAKIANAKFESLSLFSLLLLQKVVKPKISFK